MIKTRDRTESRSNGEHEEIRIRRAILQFVTGHPYCELPPPVGMQELVNAHQESRSGRPGSVRR